MSDLISRHDAIDALNEYFARIGKLKRRGLTKGEKAISLDTVGVIKTLPFAEPKRNTGEWITDACGNVICSECGWCAPKIMKGCLANRHLDYEKSEFCWHCGAYMRGEQE